MEALPKLNEITAGGERNPDHHMICKGSLCLTHKTKLLVLKIKSDRKHILLLMFVLSASDPS